LRGDGADLFDGLAEFAVVELLAAGGVFNADEAADLVGAVAARLINEIFKERWLGYSHSGAGILFCKT
jgi:hypothetical protein